MADSSPFLVINPNANNGKTGKQIDEILLTAKNIFGEFTYELTTQQGDGFLLAKKAKEQGYRTIVSIGGDGTLNEILNIVANSDIKIGMIAKGGACDAHQTHGIPRHLEKSMQIIANGYSEKFPIGLAKGDTNRYFMEMADGAFTGAVAEASHYRMKWLYGDIRYILLALQMAFSYKPIPSRVTIDGQTIEANATVLAVSLSDVISGFELFPGNHPRKGAFEIVVGEDYRRLTLMYWLIKALNGKHLKAKKLKIFSGKKVTIESDMPMSWEAEGEIFSKSSTKVEFEYHPNAINLIIPKGWNYELSKKEKTAAIKEMLKKK